MAKVRQLKAQSCPKGCGIAVAAGSKTAMREFWRQHNRAVHPHTRKDR